MLLNVVGIDPGNSLGTACLSVDTETCQITAHDSTTVDIDNVIKYYHEEMLSVHGTLLTRTYVIGEVVGKYCQAWEPDYFCHETAFSAHGRQKFGNSIESFASLRENILAIKLASMKYEPTLPICPVNPNTVKYAVMDHKSSDKAEIATALKALPDLTIMFNTDNLDQHGWDAMAIAYTFIKKRILGVPKREHPKRNKRTKRNKNNRA